MKLSTVVTILVFTFVLALTAVAQTSTPPSPTPVPAPAAAPAPAPGPTYTIPVKPVNELTRLRIANAYQKIMLAIDAYKSVLAQSEKDEGLTPGEHLQFDPASEQVVVIPAAPTPPSAPREQNAPSHSQGQKK